MKLILAKEFHNKWLEKNEDSFLYYGQLDISELNVSQNDYNFLTISGIPKWAAPNLHFYVPDKVVKIAGHFFSFGEDAIERKICIDTNNDAQVIILDENNINKNIFNSNIQTMCMSLLSYMYMVDDAIITNGNNAFIKNKIPLHLIARFEDGMRQYDSFALQEGSFWMDEIERLRNKDIKTN